MHAAQLTHGIWPAQVAHLDSGCSWPFRNGSGPRAFSPLNLADLPYCPCHDRKRIDSIRDLPNGVVALSLVGLLSMTMTDRSPGINMALGLSPSTVAAGAVEADTALSEPNETLSAMLAPPTGLQAPLTTTPPLPPAPSTVVTAPAVPNVPPTVAPTATSAPPPTSAPTTPKTTTPTTPPLKNGSVALNQATAPKNTATCTTSRAAMEACWGYLVRQYSWNANEAFSIMWCESRGDPNARNPRSTATGLFQILNGPTDPAANVKLAFEMYQKRGWQPWVCRA